MYCRTHRKPLYGLIGAHSRSPQLPQHSRYTFITRKRQTVLYTYNEYVFAGTSNYATQSRTVAVTAKGIPRILITWQQLNCDKIKRCSTQLNTLAVFGSSSAPGICHRDRGRKHGSYLYYKNVTLGQMTSLWYYITSEAL